MGPGYPLVGGIRQDEGDRCGYHNRRHCIVAVPFLTFMICLFPTQNPQHAPKPDVHLIHLPYDPVFPSLSFSIFIRTDR